MPIKRDFSWSYSRFRLFKTCERAYYYRYYGSWEGWDDYADEHARLLYRLKNLRFMRSWIDEVLRTAIKSVFIDSKSGNMDFNLQNLQRSALRRLRNEWGDAVSGAWKTDPKKLNLFEIYYADSDPSRRKESLLEEATNTLLGYLVKFTESKIFPEIKDVSYLMVREFETPDFFLFKGITVWVSPDLLWLEKGNANIVNIHTGNSEYPQIGEDWEFQMGLCLLFAEQKLRIPRDRIIGRTVFLNDGENDLSPIYNSHNLVEICAVIEESSLEMLKRVSMGNSISESLFPGNPSPSKCQICEFHTACPEK